MRSINMKNDPIVDEVRKARKKTEEGMNNDIHLMAEFIRKEEEKSRLEGWKIVDNKDFLYSKK